MTTSDADSIHPTPPGPNNDGRSSARVSLDNITPAEQRLPRRDGELLRRAGFGDGKKPAKAVHLISTSGSGQMLPLTMNEQVQKNRKSSASTSTSCPSSGTR